jgi:anti-sigma factor RsiW
MQTSCPDPTDRLSPADLDAHLAHCPTCRAQWSLHRDLLAGLGGGAVPVLSRDFDADLNRSLSRVAAGAPSRAPAWPRVALLSYWAAAAAACLFILIRLDLVSWIAALSPAERAWSLIAALATPMVALFDFGWLHPTGRTGVHSAG